MKTPTEARNNTALIKATCDRKSVQSPIMIFWVVTYPGGALVERIYSHLHDDFDRPQAERTHDANNRIHGHATGGIFASSVA